MTRTTGNSASGMVWVVDCVKDEAVCSTVEDAGEHVRVRSSILLGGRQPHLLNYFWKEWVKSPKQTPNPLLSGEHRELPSSRLLPALSNGNVQTLGLADEKRTFSSHFE